MLRTHTCGELRKDHIGKSVKLCGWVDTIREHGSLIFIDLRDRYGKTQVIVTKSCRDFQKAKSLSLESSAKIQGKVQARKSGTENKNIETGEIEIFAEALEIYNKAPLLPFEINDLKVSEDVKLKNRYLDLRNMKLQQNLITRHKIYSTLFEFLTKQGFIWVDTPMLAKSTPEGARDYIVPSRVNPGKFYALPQSPQLFKQLLMVSGFDRYFQIARCFRDEDLRADRQPEFTQLDIEMSFIDVEDIIAEMESLFRHIFKQVLDINIKTPFPRISYEEAMKKYKTDAPDIRKNKSDKNEYAFVWVVDFPAFEYNKEDKRWYAVHHPFTSPEDNADFSNPGKIKAKAYDLVLNGSEIGGGSIRIHNHEMQNKVFETLGISKKEAQNKFSFLLEALSYGAPPHGGIAFGLDRITAIMTHSESIRDVIAFPKNKAAQDIMLDAPSEVSPEQLKETHIQVNLPKQEKKKK
ncbi:MAG: aspartate--tRNA ligase [Nanoarchaeota archaeon]